MAIFSPKRRFLQEPHGVTSQKTAFLISYKQTNVMGGKTALIISVRKDERIFHSRCSASLTEMPKGIPICAFQDMSMRKVNNCWQQVAVRASTAGPAVSEFLTST
jgi:hypothetical protein